MARLLCGQAARFAALALLFAAVQPASAQMPPIKIEANELAGLMTAYVEAVVEMRQLFLACDPAKEPPQWEEGVGVLIASLQAAGIDLKTAEQLRSRLAVGTAGSAAYDCADTATKMRMQFLGAARWPVYHEQMLQRAGIRAVVPTTPDDPRLAALRVVFARYTPKQAEMLNCMALVEANFLPGAYGEWNGMLDEAQATITGAGIDPATAAGLTEPARPVRLLTAIADRQQAIASCLKNSDWLNWASTLQVFSFLPDLREALGLPR